jgi:DNA-directed RNA polymerase specialized sigma24 family protein
VPQTQVLAYSGTVSAVVDRIASRQAFRHRKNERRWPDGTTEALTLDDMPAQNIRPSTELLRELLSLDGLSAPNRAVLALHFQEELTLVEVAAILALPLGVKSRLAYGLSALACSRSDKRRTDLVLLRLLWNLNSASDRWPPCHRSMITVVPRL